MKARQQAGPPREDSQRKVLFFFFYLFFFLLVLVHFFSFFFLGGCGRVHFFGGEGRGVVVLPGWLHMPLQGYYQIILVVNGR